MRPSSRLVSALLPTVLLTAFTAACGDVFTAAPDDASPDQQGCCDPGDSAPGNDTGNPQPDSGQPNVDSGSPDSGTDTDSSTTTDSGSPDSGCGSCDSGLLDTGTDSGSPDTGTDSGVDSGVDSGTDSGVEAGSEGGVDAGLDAPVDAPSDAPVDAPSDSGSDADGGCVSLTTTCAGDQPLICQSGAWVTNGGVCDYACNAGACLCNDPYGDGGTGRFKPQLGGSLLDTSTGLTWYTTVATSKQSYSSAVSDCMAYSARLPHLSELQAILAEQPSNLFCSSFDGDSQFQSLFSMLADYYWTDSPPSGHPLDKAAVNFKTGDVCDAYLAPCASSPYFSNLYTICVSP